MGELRSEYEGVVDLTIVPAEETKLRQAELERYNLLSRGHGMIALTRGGEVVFTIGGHNFGRDAIELAIGQVREP